MIQIRFVHGRVFKLAQLRLDGALGIDCGTQAFDDDLIVRPNDDSHAALQIEQIRPPWASVGGRSSQSGSRMLHSSSEH